MNDATKVDLWTITGTRRGRPGGSFWGIHRENDRPLGHEYRGEMSSATSLFP